MNTNPNRDTLHNIKRWLNNRETDEKIDSKSKDRVHTMMAKQIRQIRPLPIGACNLCGNYSERLVPMSFRVCQGCLKSIIKKGGELELRRELGPNNCDLCLNHGIIMYRINPLVCVKCTSRQGRHHKRNISEYKDDREKRMIKSMED